MYVSNRLNGLMCTTIDIPDDVYRRAKARAALEGRKLKDLVADYVRDGLTREAVLPGAQRRARSVLPVIRVAAGKTLPSISNAEIEDSSTRKILRVRADWICLM